VLGQAISSSIAFQNNKWTSEHPTELHEVKFDPVDIENWIRNITTQNMFFLQFFAFMGVQPIAVVYEKLENNLQDVICDIGQSIGLEKELLVDESSIRLKTQRNEKNVKFRERFLNDYPKILVPKKNGLSGSFHPISLSRLFEFGRRKDT
jgi:LPS sulfotransferase NodH